MLWRFLWLHIVMWCITGAGSVLRALIGRYQSTEIGGPFSMKLLDKFSYFKLCCTACVCYNASILCQKQVLYHNANRVSH